MLILATYWEWWKCSREWNSFENTYSEIGEIHTTNGPVLLLSFVSNKCFIFRGTQCKRKESPFDLYVFFYIFKFFNRDDNFMENNGLQKFIKFWRWWSWWWNSFQSKCHPPLYKLQLYYYQALPHIHLRKYFKSYVLDSITKVFTYSLCKIGLFKSLCKTFLSFFFCRSYTGFQSIGCKFTKTECLAKISTINF